MTAILALLSTGLGKAILAALAGLVAIAAAYIKGKSAGKDNQKAKQAQKDLAAAQDRLEMDREATEAERKAAGMTDKQAYEEAMKWAKR